MQVEIQPSLMDLYKLRGDLNLKIENVMTQIEDAILSGLAPDAPEVQALEVALKTAGLESQRNNLAIQELLADRTAPDAIAVVKCDPVVIEFDPKQNGYAAAHLLRVATGAKSFDIDYDRYTVSLYHTTEGDYIWCQDAYKLGWDKPRNTIDFKNYLSVRRGSWLQLIDGVGTAFPVVSGFVSAFHTEDNE